MPYNDRSVSAADALSASKSEMLEHRVLLIRPRTAAALQAIVDGESGAPLGWVRWKAESPSSWWRLFGRSVLAVHEHEDEPLLFTLRRVWGFLPRREVRDAEDQPVGSFFGRLVHDRHGQPLAALQAGAFRSPRRRILAELETTAEGLRIAFSPDIAGEPFVKMLLLAAALHMAG